MGEHKAGQGRVGRLLGATKGGGGCGGKSHWQAARATGRQRLSQRPAKLLLLPLATAMFIFRGGRLQKQAARDEDRVRAEPPSVETRHREGRGGCGERE